MTVDGDGKKVPELNHCLLNEDKNDGVVGEGQGGSGDNGSGANKNGEDVKDGGGRGGASPNCPASTPATFSREYGLLGEVSPSQVHQSSAGGK